MEIWLRGEKKNGSIRGQKARQKKKGNYQDQKNITDSVVMRELFPNEETKESQKNKQVKKT